jgi:hypothetical protein
MVMKNKTLTMKKPWVLLVFVLMAINTIVALTGAFGIAGNPLDALATNPASMLVAGGATTSAAGGMSVFAMLLLALDVIILYGLSQGHVWSWYLLLFVTAASVIAALVGAVTGTALDFIPLVINVVMLAALLKKEVIGEFQPDLKIIPADGVW